MFEAFEDFDVPDHLRRNVEQHCENLSALVDTFGKAGVDEETIERSVAQVIDSYQTELLNSMKMLHRDASDARRKAIR